MAYTLRMGEMLAVMHNAEMTTEAKLYQGILESIGTAMAAHIANKFRIGFTDATYDVGMVASAFKPASPDQELPEAMKGFDNEAEWGEED